METKPGYKTTEFWLTILTNIVIGANLAGAFSGIPNRYAALVAAIVNGAYAISRGQAKQGVAYDPKAGGTNASS